MAAEQYNIPWNGKQSKLIYLKSLKKPPLWILFGETDKHKPGFGWQNIRTEVTASPKNP
jgi:hypothetical protein